MSTRVYIFYAVFSVLSALLITVAFQQTRIDALKADLARAEAQVAIERAERLEAAKRHAEIIAAAQAEHATRQQEAEHEWNQEKIRLAAARRDDVELVRRLRAQIAAAVSSRRGAAGPTDSAPAERRVDPAADIARLLAEGVALVAEGRRLVEQRDAEVSRLLDQVRVDRTACAVGGVEGATLATTTDLSH